MKTTKEKLEAVEEHLEQVLILVHNGLMVKDSKTLEQLQFLAWKTKNSVSTLLESVKEPEK